jgi:hypothetical protein
VVAWRPPASACSRASCLLASREHLERDFEVHVLAFSRQGGPKSHVRSLMVFGNVMWNYPGKVDKFALGSSNLLHSNLLILYRAEIPQR